MDNKTMDKTWLVTVKSVNNKGRNLKAMFLEALKLATSRINININSNNNNNNKNNKNNN